MNFAESARNLIISPEQGQEYSATHDLSLVMGTHVHASTAQVHLPLIPEGSLVFVESSGYYESRVGTVDSDALTSDTLPGKKQISEMATLLGNMPYAGEQLLRMKDEEPVRYESYRDRMLEATSSVDALMTNFDMNAMNAGYKAHLYFGLVDRNCFITPGDANNTQLPLEDYLGVQQTANGPLPTAVLDSAILSNQMYRDIVHGVETYHDMHHYRDYATVHNVVTHDERRVCQVLGAAVDGRLPTALIRGHGHAQSVSSLLLAANVEFTGKFASSDTPIHIGTTFAPNADTQGDAARRSRTLLTDVAAKIGADKIKDLTGVDSADLLGSDLSLQDFVAKRDLLLDIHAFEATRNGMTQVLRRRSIRRAAARIIAR